jgi:hypothetical protein
MISIQACPQYDNVLWGQKVEMANFICVDFMKMENIANAII